MTHTRPRIAALVAAFLAGRFSAPDPAALADDEREPRRWPATSDDAGVRGLCSPEAVVPRPALARARPLPLLRCPAPAAGGARPRWPGDGPADPIDHMDPLERGGSSGLDKVIACCRSCNSRKDTKPFTDWLDRLGERHRTFRLMPPR